MIALSSAFVLTMTVEIGWEDEANYLEVYRVADTYRIIVSFDPRPLL